MIKVDVGLNAKGKPCRIFVTFDHNSRVVTPAQFRGQEPRYQQQSLHLSCRGAMELVGQLIQAVNKILFHF